MQTEQLEPPSEDSARNPAKEARRLALQTVLVAAALKAVMVAAALKAVMVAAALKAVMVAAE